MSDFQAFSSVRKFTIHSKWGGNQIPTSFTDKSENIVLT